MSRRPVTLVLPYYENPAMLRRQVEHLMELREDVRDVVHLIVVDDGSPKAPAESVSLPDCPLEHYGLASSQLFRIDVDVRWNWLAARNIGVHHAPTDWVLLTDIDHLVPELTFRRITEKKLDPRSTYRFSRVDAPDLTPYKPHPNSWLFTRELFDKIGGYDERFSGFYGTDGEFRDRVIAASNRVVMLDEALIRVPREVVPDASTTTYGRKEPQDREGVTKARARIAQEGGRPHRLTFPYHKVA